MPQCGCGDGWVLADVRMLVCGLLIATALFMMSRSRDSKSNIALQWRIEILEAVHMLRQPPAEGGNGQMLTIADKRG